MNESVGLIVTKIEELIRACAGQVTAFYPIVKQQQIIQAIMPMIILPISILMIPIVLKLEKKADWNGGNVYCFLTIIIGIFTALGLMWGIIGSVSGISTLLNPDYYAVQDLFNLGKTLIAK